MVVNSMTWIYIMVGVYAVSLISVLVLIHHAADYNSAWDDDRHEKSELKDK